MSYGVHFEGEELSALKSLVADSDKVDNKESRLKVFGSEKIGVTDVKREDYESLKRGRGDARAKIVSI